MKNKNLYRISTEGFQYLIIDRSFPLISLDFLQLKKTIIFIEVLPVKIGPVKLDEKYTLSNDTDLTFMDGIDYNENF